jgi:H+/Cl- antiporter ClcA
MTFKTSIFVPIIKWAIIVLISGCLIGSASAGFLWSLDLVTDLSFHQSWLLFCLPLIGIIIAFIYAKSRPELGNGNAFIMRSFFKEDEGQQTNKETIPFLLTPLIFLGTLLTHLGGGSAGREGTAVQMGASISSQMNRWFNLNRQEQRLLTCVGISAGFAGVFGTPLAAGLFAIEFFNFKKTRWFFLIACLVAAFVADMVCLQWGIQHAQYQIVPFANHGFTTIKWVAIAGILYGIAAMLFVQSSTFFTKLFAKIKVEIIRPIIGSVFFIAIILLTGQEKMMGLGLPVIEDAFIHQQGSFDFLMKILLTSFILSAGFKGGEVTPLFFIGAVLGSSLIAFIPLPISLLAGLGLVAVFAGATHCVLTSIILGIEIFGIEYTFYIFLSCGIAYLISGRKNIYEGRPESWMKKYISTYFL